MTRAAHEAVEAIFVHCFQSFAVLPGARALDGDGIAGVLTDVPMTFFNGIGSTRFDGDVDRRIENTIDIFRARSRGFRWWVGQSTEPPGLASALQAHGFRHVWDSTGMFADLAQLKRPLATPGLTIARVTGPDSLKQWGDVLGTVFKMPPRDVAIWTATYAALRFDRPSAWTLFVGFVDGKPVATSSLLLAGDLAGIYHVGTLEEARGRGIGAAITLEAMQCGRDAGASMAVLQASEMGASVYRAIGFEHSCDLSLYDWRPDRT